jgi:hypothetical protein
VTAYAVNSTVRATGGTASHTSAGLVAVTAGSFELKLTRIEAWTAPVITVSGDFWAGDVTAPISRYSGAASGGTAITPLPMRQGAPPSTATGRYANPLTVGGTSSLLAGFYTGATATSSYDFPLDVTISPGSSIVVQPYLGTTSGNSYEALIVIYFEELRLTWHY